MWFKLVETCSHLLIYWPAEDSVTAVSACAVNNSSNLNVGEECEISVNKKGYNGRVAAKGSTNAIYIHYNYYYKYISKELRVKWKCWRTNLLLESGYHHSYNLLQLLNGKENKAMINSRKRKRQNNNRRKRVRTKCHLIT